MRTEEILDCLEQNPVIAAIGDDKWDRAVQSPVKVLFHLSANILTVEQQLRQAHEAGKYVMVHLDLMEGLGRDRSGIRYLKQLGADGVISTRAQLIRMAREENLAGVQRFFALDSKGLDSMEEVLRNTSPRLIEIMPGVIPKTIRRFSGGNIPVIAGGLIETKAEVTEALSQGATAVSTGKEPLWYL